MTKANDPFEVFWQRTDRRGPDECWPWNGYLSSAGYAKVWVRGKLKAVSHIALEIDGRPRLRGLFALHSCDNPRCVNPAHLRWGNHQENCDDKMSRGRHKMGDPRLLPHFRRTEGVVAAILNSEDSNVATARALGISAPTVQRVRVENGMRRSMGPRPVMREKVLAALKAWADSDGLVYLPQTEMAALLDMPHSNFSVALTALCRSGAVTKLYKRNAVWTLRVRSDSVAWMHGA